MSIARLAAAAATALLVVAGCSQTPNEPPTMTMPDGGVGGVGGAGDMTRPTLPPDSPDMTQAAPPLFASVCTPTIEFVNDAANGDGALFDKAYPQPKPFLQAAALKVCEVLYRKTSEACAATTSKTGRSTSSRPWPGRTSTRSGTPTR